MVALTAKIRRDYGIGDDIQHRAFVEFNDLSVLGVMEQDQRSFNNYVFPKSTNPDEAWRFNGIRPLTRNKLIGIAAHTTAVLLYPNVFAQNDADEEDREAAQVMRDLVEYDIRNSEYELEFLFAVVSALVNPCVYLQASFDEVMQTIKEKDEKGQISKKEVMDEVLSGFHTNVIPVDEMLIANPYEFEHQRQRFVIRKRLIDYDEAEALYGKHANFTHVRPGVKILYSESGAFFDVNDDQLTTLVEEVTYRNRREDMEIQFVNGIFMSDGNIEVNRIRHRDTSGAPKYAEAKSGYEPIDDGRFYYFKSAANKFAHEQKLADRMYQLAMDGAFLDTMPPMGVFGDEVISASVSVPGRVTVFNRDTTTNPLFQGRNTNMAFQALEKIENSVTESSQDNLRAGVPGPGGRTAFEISQQEQNARIQLGLFGKMIARLIRDFGNLTIDIIVNHQTVGEAIEKMGEETAMKFSTFLLPEQTDKGKPVTKKIQFTDELAGKRFTEKEKMEESFKMMEEEGGYDSEKRIIKVNPSLFRKLKFKIMVVASNLLPKNEMLQKAMNLEFYDRAMLDPFSNKEQVARDFLYETFAKGESAKYMQKAQQMLGTPMEQPNGVKKKTSTPLVQQLQGGSSLGTLLAQ